MVRTSAGWLIAVGSVVLLSLPGSALAEGALAMGSTGNVSRDGIAYGGAYNYGTRDAAMAEALAKCRAFQGAPKAIARCKVVSTFRQTCYAVANDPKAGTPGTGWATAPTKEAASQRALEECQATAGRDRRDQCVVDQSNCDVND